MDKEKTRSPTKGVTLAPDGSPASVLEWLPLVSAFRETVEWVLDVAADIARDYPEEVAAVERVRGFLRARMEGYPAALRLRDALFTVALIMAAIERDVGPLRHRGLSFKNPGEQLQLALERARARLQQIEQAKHFAA